MPARDISKVCFDMMLQDFWILIWSVGTFECAMDIMNREYDH